MTRLRHERITTKELLKIAQDELSTPEQLSKVWDITRSVKIRKAVASNPNASALTLRVAARLYLEEVLENPGFQMLNLFDDDLWVKKIGEVHQNPDLWTRSYYYGSRADQLEPFARAALLSESLNETQLNSIMEFLPVASLKRAFKYEKTKDRARLFFVNGADTQFSIRNFSLESLFKAYGSELIGEEDLYESLKGICYIGTLSCRKSVYVRTVRALLKAFDNNAELAGRLLAMILISSRVSCIGWVERLFERKHLFVIAKALLTAKQIKKKGKEINRPGAAATGTIKTLASVISSIVWGPLNFEQRKSGLGAFYKLMCQLGLENHKWGDSKQTWNCVQISNEMCDALLSQDIRVKSFYVKNLCLGTWFHVQKSSSKFQVVEEVNDWLYKQGGVENVLYKDISVKKIITLTSDVKIGY